MSQARLGARVRRLRQTNRLTQTQMAEQLGISPSYLNLIEHNQRAVTVTVLLKLAQRFSIDLQDFTAEGDDHRLLSDLMEVFADPLFDGHELKNADVKDLAEGAPHVGRAVLTLYQAYRGGQGRTAASDAPLGGDTGDEPATTPVGMPAEEVGDFLQARGNHFKELEAAAEALWQEAGLELTRLYAGLADFLSARCAVDVAIEPAEAQPGLLRHYEPRSHRLFLSEMLPASSRVFQLAHQIGVLRYRSVIDRIASQGKFTTVESDRLARFALANYFAGAVMMPYERFLHAARATRYDIGVLERRFGASFEQVCHRLASLQRPGAAGVPFHFLRVDLAGNISKRFSASGITIARFGGACPRWNVYDAFGTPGLLRTAVSRMPDGATYFCIARTTSAVGRLDGRLGTAAGRSTRLAIGLGCPVSYARELVYADGLDLDDPAAIVPIGVSCRVCPRPDCADRAFPSIQQGLAIDENRRGLSVYGARVEERGLS